MDSPFRYLSFCFNQSFLPFLYISINFLHSLFLLRLIYWSDDIHKSSPLYVERKAWFEQCGECNTLKKKTNKQKSPSHILTQSKSIECMCHPYNSDVYWPFDLHIVVSATLFLPWELLYLLHFSMFMSIQLTFFDIAYMQYPHFCMHIFYMYGCPTTNLQ